MPPDAIVIAFNIAEDFRSRLFDRLERAALNQLRLKAGKETLGLRVIIAVAFAAHTLPKTIDIQQSAIFDRCVLAAAVGMNNCAAPNQTAASRPFQSVQNELCRHPPGDLPTDDPSGELILKCRQVTKLSILQRQICNIADNHSSFFNWLAD